MPQAWQNGAMAQSPYREPGPLSEALAKLFLTQQKVELGWTDQDVADRTGISRAQINHIMKGRKQPTLGEIDAICAALKLPFAETVAAADKASMRRHFNQK